MKEKTKVYAHYTNDDKINALKHLAYSRKGVNVVANELGISYATLRKWTESTWGRLKLAQLRLESNNQVMVQTALDMDKVIDAKVAQFKAQSKIVHELEDLMGLCIDKFNDLIPKTKKIHDVTEAFDSISSIYIKIINSNQEDNNKKEDKDSFILNLIEKQMVVKPIQLQEMLKE